MPPRVPCDPACPCAGPTRCARHRRSPETFLGEQRVPCAAASCALGLCTATSRLLPLPGVFPAFPVASPRRARRRARSSVPSRGRRCSARIRAGLGQESLCCECCRTILACCLWVGSCDGAEQVCEGRGGPAFHLGPRLGGFSGRGAA